MLLAAGVEPGDKVITNGFTFAAVPSSITHAGASAVYVETAENYTICLVDLEKKIASSGARYFMISHMRGKVADMDEVKRICDNAGVVLLEDCAHSLGAGSQGKSLEHFLVRLWFVVVVVVIFFLFCS
ncbi:unnamed protein product [Polarella glacialis]|uniref:Uncharacterized protein n=1 Tax=Polarella glacialis TaxID=89957 RepID=A0A813EHZ5_POLGL|nr:unnamed protein product [Polarella glacialis]